MIKEIPLEVQKQIINYVQEKYPQIPEEGFVAGQAIASLVYKYMNISLNIVINDIDIFTVCDPYTYQLIENKTNKNTSFSKCQIKYDNYGHNDFIDSSEGRGYQVVRSINLKENKDINIIKTRFFNETVDHEQSVNEELMLHSFDFNCCAVGFDIKTHKFYYTDSFIDFLNNKILRVQSAHTPLHTFIRLTKKIKELNCKCNVFQERRLLVQKLNFYKNGKEEIITGKRFWETFKKYEKELGKYFTFSDYFTQSNHIYKYCSFSQEALKEFNIKRSIQEYIEDFNFRHFPYYLNPLSFVKFYHLINNTDLFKEEYKSNIISFFKQESKNIFPVIYFNFLSQRPLSENNIIKTEELKNSFSLIENSDYFINYFNDCYTYEDYKEMFSKLDSIINRDNELISFIFKNHILYINEIMQSYDNSENEKEFIENLEKKLSNKDFSLAKPKNTRLGLYTEIELMNIHNLIDLKDKLGAEIFECLLNKMSHFYHNRKDLKLIKINKDLYIRHGNDFFILEEDNISGFYIFNPIYYRDIKLFNTPIFSKNNEEIKFNFFGLFKDNNKDEVKDKKNVRGGFIQKPKEDPDIDFEDDIPF